MMDYLSTLLSLDGVAIAEFEDAFEPGETRLSAEDRRLIAALASEVRGTATLIAVSASIANALEMLGPATVNARALVAFAPPEFEISEALRERLFEAALPGALERLTRELGARAGLARRMSLTYAQEAQGPEMGQSIDAEVLAHAWRRAAKAAAEILEALSGLDPDGQGAAATQDGILNLLNAAAQGGHPCVEAQGGIVIPGWAERRRHRRFAADLTVDIEIAGLNHVVRVFDVSAGGLGLSGLDRVMAGTAATARVPDGRRLSGTIAWAANGRAGLKFRTPLQASDPLLAGVAD